MLRPHRLVPVLSLALVACSSETTPVHVTPTAPPEIVARFEPGTAALPSFLDIPFPSDAYLEPDGTVADVIPGLDGYIPQNVGPIQAALAAQRGFGLLTGAAFRIDRARGGDAPVVDAGSLPADEAASVADSSSVFLVDLDADPAAARVPCRVFFHDDRPNGSDRPPVLSVLPARGVVLAEGHRHVVALTTAVTADGGKALGPSDTFAAIRNGEKRGTALEKLHGEAVDAVVEAVPALAGEKLAGLSVFTTQVAADELLHMEETAAALPTPAVRWDAAALAPMARAVFGDQAFPGYTATLDDWLGAPGKLADGSDDPARDQDGGAAHDALAAVGTAVFDAPNFLLDSPMGYADPTHANAARDAAGAPILNPARPTARVWVTVTLPRAPVPAGGFPVVIIQHGLQDDRSFVLTLANTFARQGWATAAIESVTFGARAPAAGDRKDEAATFAWSAAAKYSGPDGFVDKKATAISFFGAFLDFGALRDQLRQSVVDIGTLVRVLQSPGLDLGPLLGAVPGAKLDAGRMAFVGDSLGAIMGSMVAAYEPRLAAFVLNVGGGGIITELGANAPALATLLGAGSLTFGLARDRLDAGHPLAQILQTVLDPADPLTHAHRLVRRPATVSGAVNPRKNVLLIEAIGDELVANEGGEALARVIGMPLATPNVGSNAGLTFAAAKPGADGAIRGVPEAGVTAVLVQASPATHGQDFYNHLGKRHYALPFGQPGPTPFPVLPQDLPVREPYLALQKMCVGFFQSAFAGEVPAVRDFPAPRRDFDDDGVDDAADGAPADPTKH